MTWAAAEPGTPAYNAGFRGVGGGRGIRTPDTVSRTAVFKTAAINHSAIPPRGANYCAIRTSGN